MPATLQGVWSTARWNFLVPPGGIQSCTSEPSAGLSPGWCSSRQARWTCTGPRPSRESLSNAAKAPPEPLSPDRAAHSPSTTRETTVGDVSGNMTALGAATAAASQPPGRLRAPRWRGLHGPTELQEPDCTFTATSGGVRRVQQRLQVVAACCGVQ